MRQAEAGAIEKKMLLPSSIESTATPNDRKSPEDRSRGIQPLVVVTYVTGLFES
jgi:hypothetical protein